ncbi:hypothetical protein AC578_7656 [Pseudocercospora eumusae]|uniref:Uncharacterized protein n=1 Tax=Pseudocercospora eumusae TaxID=321146 RepID=A0A139H5V1_9PEZI|nr:hypothetical protein AC578_7656 [Pseudocercospora eumusae]
MPPGQTARLCFPLVVLVFALPSGLSIYQYYLKGTPVDDEPYKLVNFELSQQQINTAVGTALAFLSRSCLVLALSTAYTQAFWWTITRDCTPARLSTIDVLYSVLSNVCNLFRPRTWSKHPLLLLTALVTWLIPIAAIITPATLSVAIAAVTPSPSEIRSVPMADFESLKFFAPGQSNTFTGLASVDTVFYNGPTYMVERIAYSVATGGTILPISPSAPNTSWSLDFNGPALRCNNINATMQALMQTNILNAYRGNSCQQPYNYLAWTAANGSPTPSEGIASNEDPFGNHAVPFSDSTPFTMNQGTLGPLLYDAVGAKGNATTNGTANATQVATIYFAAIPKFKYRELGSCNANPNMTAEQVDVEFGRYFVNSTILECQLWNTSYHTDFTYVDGQQSIDITTSERGKDIPVDTLAGFYMNGDYPKCAGLNIDYEGCNVDRYTLQRLSFQAILDAFGRVFVGTVLDGQQSKYGGTYTTATKVMSTVLLDTKELSFLRAPSNWATAAETGTYTHLGSTDNMPSLYDWTAEARQKPFLKHTIEELFQNITLSMLSSAHFHPNTSSPFAPHLVNVTSHIYHNVYEYSAAKLWLTYGLAIAFTLLGVVFGLLAIFANGASYSDDFSTILRTARYARLSDEVQPGDEDGRDPLPRYLGAATVGFKSCDTKLVSRVENKDAAGWHRSRRLTDMPRGRAQQHDGILNVSYWTLYNALFVARAFVSLEDLE